MESGACTGKLWGIQDARAGSSVAAAFMDDKNASSLQQVKGGPHAALACASYVRLAGRVLAGQQPAGARGAWQARR